jgi:hypothetical protein
MWRIPLFIFFMCRAVNMLMDYSSAGGGRGLDNGRMILKQLPPNFDFS